MKRKIKDFILDFDGLDNHLGDLASEVKEDNQFPDTTDPNVVRQHFESIPAPHAGLLPTVELLLQLYENQYPTK